VLSRFFGARMPEKQDDGPDENPGTLMLRRRWDGDTHRSSQTAGWNGARPPMQCIGKKPEIDYLICSFFRQLQSNSLYAYDCARKRPGFRAWNQAPK
jgi:hypothetical protein